jgi:hypothetical protein
MATDNDDVTISVRSETARIADLERQIAELRHPATSSGKPVGRKPDTFTGSRKNRAIQSWIKTMDDYFELNRNSLGTPREVLLMAASYLGDSAKGDYNSYVESKGEFTSWTDMKKWLNDTYNPVDPINSARRNFFNCKQRNGETPDEFYRRFTDCKNMLDTPLPDTYVTYFFTLHLLWHYQEQIYTDNDFAKWDKSLDDIVAKIKRGPPPPASQSSNLSVRISGGRPTDLADRITSERANKRQKISNETKRHTPATGGSSGGTLTTGKYDETPLTDGQRKFLDQNIIKGGGIIVSDAVQNKADWIKEARQRNLCIKCAGSGHYRLQCPAIRRSTTGLNAILPGIGDLNSKPQL